MVEQVAQITADLVDRPTVRKVFAPHKPNGVTDRTVNQYESEGLAYMWMGGRKYYRLEVVRKFILARETRRNPPRRAA